MITIQCLVDNTVLTGSTYWGEHGVSFYIQSPAGCMLFDTGQSGEVLLHNAKQMKINLRDIDALAISHAHLDHTGGLHSFLTKCKPKIPLYANPDLFRKRYAWREGEAKSIGLKLSKKVLSQHSSLCLNADPLEILPGIWTSGEISDRLEFEGRSSRHHIRVKGKWLPDPYRDDLSLIIEAGEGLILICGCCHAGLINTLSHVKRKFQKDIVAVIGGTHLTSATEEMLEHTIDYLRRLNNGAMPVLYLNHCTGERAHLTLVQNLGGNVQACPAGMTITF